MELDNTVRHEREKIQAKERKKKKKKKTSLHSFFLILPYFVLAFVEAVSSFSHTDCALSLQCKVEGGGGVGVVWSWVVVRKTTCCSFDNREARERCLIVLLMDSTVIVKPYVLERASLKRYRVEIYPKIFQVMLACAFQLRHFILTSHSIGFPLPWHLVIQARC